MLSVITSIEVYIGLKVRLGQVFRVRVRVIHVFAVLFSRCCRCVGFTVSASYYSTSEHTI